jgi:type I restriction enzyme S subunit
MREWQEVMLQDVVTVLGDGLHGTPEYDNNGEYYFINGNNLNNGKIIIKENTKQTSKKEYEKFKKNLNSQTILISINGTLGNVALYNNEKCILGKSACYFNVREDVDKFFIRYLVSNWHFQTYISEFAHGTTIKNVSLKTIREYSLLLPTLPEQKAIAAVLSSLDDKIDLLHRQNKTLEALAETLFRQWFIEEAQEDWEEKSLLDLVELVGGGTPKTSMNEYWNGEIPWLSGGDIATNHKGFVSASEKTITKAGLDNSSAKLLPKFATVISARGTVGKYCMLANNMAFSQSNYGILPRIEGCYYFTYLLVNHVVEELQSAAYGSVFDTITTSTFRDATFTVPPTDKILAFENFISNYFGKKLLNQTQIRTLEKLRDTLLPKLMSGEVRVTP